MLTGGIYGLRKNEKGEFEINEEDNVVKLIYKLRLEGFSFYNHYLKTDNEDLWEEEILSR